MSSFLRSHFLWTHFWNRASFSRFCASVTSFNNVLCLVLCCSHVRYLTSLSSSSFLVFSTFSIVMVRMQLFSFWIPEVNHFSHQQISWCLVGVQESTIRNKNVVGTNVSFWKERNLQLTQLAGERRWNDWNDVCRAVTQHVHVFLSVIPTMLPILIVCLF